MHDFKEHFCVRVGEERGKKGKPGTAGQAENSKASQRKDSQRKEGSRWISQNKKKQQLNMNSETPSSQSGSRSMVQRYILGVRTIKETSNTVIRKRTDKSEAEADQRALLGYKM